MAKKKKKKRSKPKNPKVQNTDPQAASLLFQRLPQELRDDIYSLLFSCTRLAFGERAITRLQRVRIVPAPNSLALLRTCRRAKEEIGQRWLSQVLFSFEGPESMLDKLAAIPIDVLSMVRYLRVVGNPLVLSWPDDDVFFRLSKVLKLLPGLRLDKLTVLGTRYEKVSYHTLDLLIRESSGWKELYYLSHHSTMLAYPRDGWFSDRTDENPYWRRPQPSTWQDALLARDGESSGALVTIYRATGKGPTVMQSRTRFDQKVADDNDPRTFGILEDQGLMAPAEREKEILVIAKRGYGVDYTENPASPLLDGDIRAEMPGMTWSEIKRELSMLCKDSDDDWSSNDGEDGMDVEADSYKRVDDYSWPPRYFMSD